MFRSLLFLLMILTVLTPALARGESLVEQKDDLEIQLNTKRTEIQQLEAQIEQYRKDITKNQGQTTTIQSKINVLLQQIKKLNLEIRLLARALEETQLNIKKTERSIKETVSDISEQKHFLGEQIRILDQQHVERTILAIFFTHTKVSDALRTLQNILAVQQKTKSAYDKLRGLEVKLSDTRSELEDRRQEQARLLALQESQRREVLTKQQTHERLLTDVKKKTTKLKELVAVSKDTIEALKNEIYALQRIGVTVEDALRLGQLAAERTGIRAAFLIAVLEVESRLGLNVGKGTYKTDMNPNQHEAFLALMKELGRDPDKTPVSKKPSYGWGGAMGPGQFLPQTWIGYKSEIVRLTGHNPPDPWNIEDAFIASGIMLGRNGATSQTAAGELRAAKTYISGNPNCTKSICSYYSNLVLDKAGDIEAALKKN